MLLVPYSLSMDLLHYHDNDHIIQSMEHVLDNQVLILLMLRLNHHNVIDVQPPILSISLMIFAYLD